MTLRFGPARPRDTQTMLRTLVWLARAAGFLLVGLLALLGPPGGPHAVPVFTVGYGLVGVGIAAWALVELYPGAAGHRASALPVILGAIAVAAGFASGPGGSAENLVAFAAMAALSAGSDTSAVAAMAVTASGILAIEVGGAVYGDGIGTLLGNPLLLVVGLLLGRNRGSYRIRAEQSAALLAQYERLQTEQRRADVLDERTRIAREIHDVLAHSLGALGIQIQAARAVLEDRGDIDRAVEVLTTAQRMASDGLVETRRAVHALRVDTLPLDEELARAADTHGRRYGVGVSFETGGGVRPLPPDATIALLRTAQEALINAAKHAEGRRVAVRLDYGDHDVRLTVVNDLPAGRLAGPRDTSGVDGGYGLTGMHERLRLLDGTLAAGPHDGQWAVTARLPSVAPLLPSGSGRRAEDAAS